MAREAWCAHVESISKLLRRIASTGVVWTLGLLSLFVLLMINVRGLPGAFHSDALRQAGLLDMTINYSPEIAYAKLAAYGEQGRYAYRLFLDYVDSIFPALYGLFFLLGTTYAFARVFPGRPRMAETECIDRGNDTFRLCGELLLPGDAARLPAAA